jgi:hypothetical protein
VQSTHFVAISNKRIHAMRNGMVTFTFRDYAHNNAGKSMTITILEFIRRFLMHIVPKGFVRIRHCGFLASRNRSTELARYRAIFRKKPSANRKEQSAARSWPAIVKEHFYGATMEEVLLCNTVS